jgi:TonB family protein
VQGVVVLDAIIGVEGCVSRLSVNRGVDPRLDLAALLSVMSWRFSPARLDDRPAPVIMTVTVRFSLR